MSHDVLERAKAIQAKTATDTRLWLSLDLLEGLIDEIEALRHRVDALSQDHRKRHPANVGEVVSNSLAADKALKARREAQSG